MRQPTHQVADITVLSDSISASSPLGPVSPLMGSFSLGSTDMDISSSDTSLEAGKYIVNSCKVGLLFHIGGCAVQSRKSLVCVMASAVFHVADLHTA